MSRPSFEACATRALRSDGIGSGVSEGGGSAGRAVCEVTETDRTEAEASGAASARLAIATVTAPSITHVAGRSFIREMVSRTRHKSLGVGHGHLGALGVALLGDLPRGICVGSGIPSL